jgi:NET1-associated nuclear protein 1 (U3 small nucleolar RNA-associated protein 17)
VPPSNFSALQRFLEAAAISLSSVSVHLFFLNLKERAIHLFSAMSDTQLKRKRSQRDAAALPKRQKSDHLDQNTTTTPKPVKTQTPKSTPKTQILDSVSTPTVILPQTAGSTDNNVLQVATTSAQGKKARRGRDASRRKGADRVAVDQGQVVDKPQARVDGKSPWTLSKPLGGRFVLHDPIFAQDERYARLCPSFYNIV